MLYQTAQILGSYYFEKRRGIVNGLITRGTGLGLFIFSPLTALLIEKFALSGTFYILAGIALQGVVCGVTIISPHRALRLKLYHQHQHQHRHSSHHSYHNGLHHRMRKGCTLIFDSGAKFITSAIHISQLSSEEHDRHNPALDILLPVQLLRPLLGISRREQDTHRLTFRHHIRIVKKKDN